MQAATSGAKSQKASPGQASATVPFAPATDKNKSIAQRVMEVTANKQELQTASTTTTSIKKLSCSSSTTTDNDLEVDDITNAVGACSMNQQQQQSGDQNNNSGNGLGNNIARYSGSSSPSSILLAATEQRQQTNLSSSSSSSLSRNVRIKVHEPSEAKAACGSSLINNEQQQQVFRTQLMGGQSSQKVCQQMTTLGSDKNLNYSMDKAVPNITLNTKVPLNSLNNSTDEVSYYNDSQVLDKFDQNQNRLNPSSGASGIKGASSGCASNSTGFNGAFGSPHANNVPGPANLMINHRNPLNLLQATNNVVYHDYEDNNTDDYDTRYDKMFDCQPANQTNGFLSTPNSPKAKSAPPTPYNLTPIAFHQNKSHLNTNLKPSPANTLPLDIRRNISATCRVVPSSMIISRQNVTNLVDQESNKTITNNNETFANEFDRLQCLNEQMLQGEIELREKNYEKAIECFDNFIELAQQSQSIDYLKKHFKVYSQRAEAYYALKNYSKAVEDSITARDLNPKYTQAYFLQGKAQFKLNKYIDSLTVISFGLTQEPSNKELYAILIEAALEAANKNFISKEFASKYELLKKQNLEDTVYILMAVLGQELLNVSLFQHAAIILESALKISQDANSAPPAPANQPPALAQDFSSNSTSSSSTATSQQQQQQHLQHGDQLAPANQQQHQYDQHNKKFKKSILSSISYAYYSMRDFEKAILYMTKELDLENEFEDVISKCKILSNLGYTYFKMKKFDKSLDSHRMQLNISMKSSLYQQAALALNAIGHIHSARNDYHNALTSHSRCLEILKQLDDNDFDQFKEYLSIGHIHLMLADFRSALENFLNSMHFLETHKNNKLSQQDYQIGLIMAHFNIAYLELKKQSFHEAEIQYKNVIEMADNILNSPSPHGLDIGTISNRQQQFPLNGSMRAFDETIKKKALFYQMRAYNDLGQAYLRLFKNCDKAEFWFQKQLDLANQLNNASDKSRAICNLAFTYQQFKDYKTALKLFMENLELVDKDQFCKAHACNYIANLYLQMGRYNESHQFYESSLKLFDKFDQCSIEKKTITLNLRTIREKLSHLNGNNIDLPPSLDHIVTPTAAVATTTNVTHKKQLLIS